MHTSCRRYPDFGPKDALSVDRQDGWALRESIAARPSGPNYGTGRVISGGTIVPSVRALILENRGDDTA